MLGAETRHERGARIIAPKLQGNDLRNGQRAKCRVGCNKEMWVQWTDPRWLGREEATDARQKNFNCVA